MIYLCETCDKREELTEAEAFDACWSYPPFGGNWGMVSPRTCGECAMSTTAWWALVVEKKTTPEELGERHIATILRIQQEKFTHGTMQVTTD